MIVVDPHIRVLATRPPYPASIRAGVTHTLLSVLIILLAMANIQPAFGFTLVLKSGKRIEGTWLGEQKSLVRFRDHNNRVLTLHKNEIDFKAMADVFQNEHRQTSLSSSGMQRNKELSPATANGPANRLKTVQILPAGSGRVDVVLVGNGDLKFDAFELQNPPRIVIDLHFVRLNSPERSVSNKAQDLFSRIRTAQYQYSPDVARVVIDLNRPVPFQILQERDALHVRLGDQPSVNDSLQNGAMDHRPDLEVRSENVTADTAETEVRTEETNFSVGQDNGEGRSFAPFEATVVTEATQAEPYEAESRSDAFFQSLFEFESDALEPFGDFTPGNQPGSVRASYKRRFTRAFRLETEGEASRRVKRDGIESESEYYLKPQFRYRLNRHNELNFYSIYKISEYEFEADHMEHTRSVGMSYVRKFGRDSLHFGYRYERNESTWAEDDYVRWVYNAGYALTWNKRNSAKIEVNYAPQEFTNRFVRGPTRGSQLQRYDRTWVVTLASVISLSQGLDLIPAYRYETKSSNGRLREPFGHLPSLRLRYTW